MNDTLTVPTSPTTRTWLRAVQGCVWVVRERVCEGGRGPEPAWRWADLPLCIRSEADRRLFTGTPAELRAVAQLWDRAMAQREAP